MGYIRRKIKTRRRVKRAKTNTRKRKQKRTFRKSRGGNRTGKRSRENKWEDTRTEKEKYEQDAIENEKDEINELRRIANIKNNMHLEPEVRGVRVNQAKKLKIAEDQLRLMDDIDAEEVPGSTQEGIWFGGKKKRTGKKK